MAKNSPKNQKSPTVLTLVVGFNNFSYRDHIGNYACLNINSLASIVRSNYVIVCNKTAIFQFNNIDNSKVLDVIELFVLLYPTANCAPTSFSLLQYLLSNSFVIDKKANKLLQNYDKEINKDKKLSLELDILTIVYDHLLKSVIDLAQIDPQFHKLLFFIFEDNWSWKIVLINFLEEKSYKDLETVVHIWNDLKEIDFSIENNLSSKSQNAIVNITEENTLKKLSEQISQFDDKREGQKIYSKAVAKCFNSNIVKETQYTNILLAEAGTGIGKTIGYTSAVLEFIEKNPFSQIVVSTYSKILQKQVYKQLKNIFDDNEEFENKVVLSKGVHNYICLLNYQYLLISLGMLPNTRLFVATITRLIAIDNHGDIIGGEITSLAMNIFSHKLFNFIRNNRDECVYARCAHFKKCFIMRNRQDVKNSNIIISNHALTLLAEGFGAQRLIFDEAHHLFNTADDIYCVDFSLQACSRIRFFLYGFANSRNKFSQLNGVKARLDTILKRSLEGMDSDNLKLHEQSNDEVLSYLDKILTLSNILPSNVSLEAILNHAPKNCFEEFFYQLFVTVLASNQDINQNYSQELNVSKLDITKELSNSIEELKNKINAILNTSALFLQSIDNKIKNSEENIEKSLLLFKESFEGSFINLLIEFLSLLYEVQEQEKDFIYRFIIAKESKNITNISYKRNYINPMYPLALSVFANKSSVIFTSATLSPNIMSNDENNQNYLNNKFGINFLENTSIDFLKLESPFDYENNTKVIVVPVVKDDNMMLCESIKSLIQASNGGTLCLFTSIERLKQTYSKINVSMQDSHINLYAQHVNNQNLTTILDMFKTDTHSCLFGTDSARDGIDIPGESLRMVLFDKFPWPRKDVLQEVRKLHLGERFINDIISQNLRQAFGRLIRKKSDKGVFVILDKISPSKYLSSFYQGVNVHKIDVKSTIMLIKDFLN